MSAIEKDVPRATSTDPSPDFANPCFLGSSGENAEIFERLLVDFLRDHVYWRRNFHPEDPLSIPVLAMQDPEFIAFTGRMRTELHTLTAALKRSVPFFNPRYLGHMVSDTLMPGLLAQMITTLYNPNNVSAEAAPVTLQMELDVGDQLASMLGYATLPGSRTRAWGHLTSGGTVANYEALVNLRLLRCYPLALKDALVQFGTALPLPALDGGTLQSLDDWALFNLPMDKVLALPGQVDRALREGVAGPEARGFRRVLAEARIEALGPAAFAERHPLSAHMHLLTPMTAHYSWRKGAKALGLGSSQILPVRCDEHMRISIPALERMLDQALESRRPVLGVVAVLGTTEFGTIDPLHEIVALRNHYRTRRLEFAVHVDAAWGGYLTSIFREPDGAFAGYPAVRREFKYFPSKTVYESFAALPSADSVTVDPHKLGYLPYGIGGIVWRDQRITHFLEERAEYLFDEESGTESKGSIKQRYGQLILEGSKPGAAAAAAWVTHRVLPLNRAHFGRLQRHTILATEYLFDRLGELRDRLAGVARLVVPFEPDTNLLCFAVNPAGNHSLARMNAFGHRLYAHMSVDPTQPVQVRDFFSSHTAVHRDMICEADIERVLGELGVDADTFVAKVADPAQQSDKLFLLRHTLMNPWLLERVDGQNYIDRYCVYLEDIVRREAAVLLAAP